jgi:hypothetical protein
MTGNPYGKALFVNRISVIPTSPAPGKAEVWASQKTTIFGFFHFEKTFFKSTGDEKVKKIKRRTL